MICGVAYWTFWFTALEINFIVGANCTIRTLILGRCQPVDTREASGTAAHVWTAIVPRGNHPERLRSNPFITDGFIYIYLIIACSDSTGGHLANHDVRRWRSFGREWSGACTMLHQFQVVVVDVLVAVVVRISTGVV
jgi:hypothetical protein